MDNEIMKKVFTKEVFDERDVARMAYEMKEQLAEEEFYLKMKKRLMKKLRRKVITEGFILKIPDTVRGFDVKNEWRDNLSEFLMNDLKCRVFIRRDFNFKVYLK